MENFVRDRLLTELDHVRLTRLVQRLGGGAATSVALAEMLDVVDVLPGREVPTDLVTMNSRVELREPGSRQARAITLSYPEEADPAAGMVSVLSPLGTQLLGLRAGDVAQWAAPDGRNHAAEVSAVLFQPEAAGDYLA